MALLCESHLKSCAHKPNSLTCLRGKLPGFSLMEAAFYLLIIGIAASLTVPLLTASQKLERHKVTQAHQDQIFHALAGYVLKYNGLPEPSTPELAGKKGTSCYKQQQGQVCVGILPYQELGLSESIARDGHGNWFTYAMAKSLLTNDARGHQSDNVAKKASFCHIKPPGIRLTSLAHVPVLAEKDDKDNHDFIAIVLVSHGPKGTGAFHPTQNKRLDAEHPQEQMNSIADNTFVMRTSQDTNSDFKHEVYWVTRNNLMAVYGKYPCRSMLEPQLPFPPLPGGGGGGSGGASSGSSGSSPIATFIPKEMQTDKPLF